MLIDVRFQDGSSVLLNGGLEGSAVKAIAERRKFLPPAEAAKVPLVTITRQIDDFVCALCGRTNENEADTVDISITSGNDLQICRPCAAHVHRSLVNQNFSHDQIF